MQSVNLVQAEQISALRARVAELEAALDGALFSVPTLLFWNQGCAGRNSSAWTKFPNGTWSIEEMRNGQGIVLRGSNGPFLQVFPTSQDVLWLQLGDGDDDVITCNAWLVDRLLDELEPITSNQSAANCQVWADFKAKARTIAKCKQ